METHDTRLYRILSKLSRAVERLGQIEDGKTLWEWGAFKNERITSAWLELNDAQYFAKRELVRQSVIFDALQEPHEKACVHKWVGRQQGGNPGETGSYEWVRFCSLCGTEDAREDRLTGATHEKPHELPLREENVMLRKTIHLALKALDEAKIGEAGLILMAAIGQSTAEPETSSQVENPRSPDKCSHPGWIVESGTNFERCVECGWRRHQVEEV